MSYHGRPHTNGDTVVIKRGVTGSLRRRSGPSGIAAFDAATGTPVRLLATTPGQTDWVMTLGWVSGHELAFTMAGSVYSWQPVDGGLRLLTDATAADRPLTDVATDLVLHP